MKALNKAVATGVALASLSFATITALPAVSADSPGQIDSGTGVYVVKNLTQKGSYGETATAACGDELEFSIRLHNSGYGTLNDINVTTTLPSNGGTSSMTATYTGGVANTATSSNSYSLASGASISYESGSTNLYDGSDNLIQSNLGNITQGVNVGSLYGSTVEYVNYKAMVSCPTIPTTTTTPTPSTPSTPAAPAPTQLVNTGPGSVVGIFAAVVVAGTVGYRWLLSRRLSRQ